MMPIAFISESDGNETKYELWEKGCCMDWELVENEVWRGCLLSSRDSSHLQFFGISLLGRKWCIWRIVVFVSCCHYEEILNYKHNTICNMIPFASLRTQKRWLNINSTRTTQNGVSPSPISLSLIASHFLSDPNTMLALFVNGLMWSFSMMETFSDSEGIFTSTAVSENIRILWNWQ